MIAGRRFPQVSKLRRLCRVVQMAVVLVAVTLVGLGVGQSLASSSLVVRTAAATRPPAPGPPTTVNAVAAAFNFCAFKCLCPTLALGDAGPVVRVLQSKLNSRDGAGLSTDGIFGPLTESAVKRFQSAHIAQVGWVDGIVGPKTWAALGGC